jgi:hypothetical protein
MSDSNTVFEGEMLNGKLYGKIFYKNGDVYTGYFNFNENNEVEPEGEGTLIYNENSIYESITGTFDDLQHSRGDLYFKDGRRLNGAINMNGNSYGVLIGLNRQ